VSFMIFRTGSVLIVGMCEENVLNDIYAFLTQLLKVEFEHICQSLIDEAHALLKDKKKKIRRKVVMIMTTLEPILENILTTVNNSPIGNSSAISSSSKSSKIEFVIEDDKEIDTTVQIKVKRSYNKKVKVAL